MNYYNENDPYAAQWLENLIIAGLIPKGHVDKRSITDVKAADIAGYIQCHFFAGVGGWPRALALAGWPSDRSVWTASPPCQPFSEAGEKKGGADDRDLWPPLFSLARELRPTRIYGEQVAAAILHGWLDRLFVDMETEKYALGAQILTGRCVGAHHIRKRLYFVADSQSGGSWARLRESLAEQDRDGAACSRSVGGMADAELLGCEARLAGDGRGQEGSGGECGEELDRCSGRPLADAGNRFLSEPERRSEGRNGHRAAHPPGCGDLDNAIDPRSQGFSGHGGGKAGWLERPTRSAAPAGFWDDAEWVRCADEKYRPVKPGIRLLAHGIPARVGRLRAYGNAIIPQVAARFIQSTM